MAPFLIQDWFFSKNRKIAQWAKKELLDECKRENKIALLSSKSTHFEKIVGAAQKVHCIILKWFHEF